MVERFDLRRDIRFSTRVTEAHFNEATRRWTVRTDQGDEVSARYAEFGDFFIGMQLPLDELFRRVCL